MRELVLYIAMSLDGYIADGEGGVAWLEGEGPIAEDEDSYPGFIESVDTVLMGHNTYRQICTELSPESWPYEGLECFVFSHGREDPQPGIHFTDTDPKKLIEELREREGKDIWLCGGADLVQQLAAEDMIDRFYITLVPCLLGGGKRLFDSSGKQLPLHLLSVRHYKGMTELIYERR